MEPRKYDIAKSTIELGQLVANARGGKNASVTLNGKPLKIHLKNCTTPFDCAGFGGGDRRSLDIRADDKIETFVRGLDEKVQGRAGNADE